jgi:hypothetical protein
MQQRDCEIAALQAELSRQLRAQESASEALLGRVGRLEVEASALRWAAETETRRALTRLQSDVGRLKAGFSALQLAPTPRSAQFDFSSSVDLPDGVIVGFNISLEPSHPLENNLGQSPPFQGPNNAFDRR